MNNYEALLDEACADGIDVIDYRFESDRIKGLYCDGTIAVKRGMNSIEKACTLAEEMGHHNTTVGDIIDMESAQNRKQERQARLWAYNKQIGLLGIVRAYESGCCNAHDVAEYLEITEEFLIECIDCYRDKYGICTDVDNYTIYFIPRLAVMKRI